MTDHSAVDGREAGPVAGSEWTVLSNAKKVNEGERGLKVLSMWSNQEIFPFWCWHELGEENDSEIISQKINSP